MAKTRATRSITAWITEDSQACDAPGPRVAFVCDAQDLPGHGITGATFSTHPAYTWRACEPPELAAAHLVVIPPGLARSWPEAQRQLVCEHRGDVVALASDLATAVLVQSGIALDFDELAQLMAPPGRVDIRVVVAAGEDRAMAAALQAHRALQPLGEVSLLLLMFAQGGFRLPEIRHAMNALFGELGVTATLVNAVGTNNTLAPGTVRASLVTRRNKA